MKQKDILLLEKLFEGSISEKESKLLLNRIQTEDINADELKQALSINAQVSTLFQEDNSKNILDIVEKLSGHSSENLNRSILSKIKQRNQKRNNNNFILKIVAFFVLCIGGIILFKLSLTEKIIEQSVASKIIVGVLKLKSGDQAVYEGDNIKSNDEENIKFILNDLSEITLHPETILHVSKNTFDIKKGHISCHIKTRKKKDQLSFISNNLKAHILGTQFDLRSYRQQEAQHSLLLLKEGLISVTRIDGKPIESKTKLTIKNLQYAHSYQDMMDTGNWKISQRPENAKHFYKQQATPWISPFWSRWGIASKDNQILTKDILSKSKDGELKINFDSAQGNSFRLRSKLVKTLGDTIKYRFNFPINFNSGSLKFGLRFYSDGIAYKEDGLILSKENGKIFEQGFEMKDGKRKLGKKQTVSMRRLQRYYIQGNINPNTSKGKINTFKNKDGKVVYTLYEIEFEFFIENLSNCKGYLEIQKGLVQTDPQSFETNKK